MSQFKHSPNCLYDVWIEKQGPFVVPIVYLMGDPDMHPVIPSCGYQSEADAIRATKRRLHTTKGAKNLLVHYNDTTDVRWA